MNATRDTYRNNNTFLQNIGVPLRYQAPVQEAQAPVELVGTETDPIVSRIVKNKIVACLWSMLTEEEKRAAYNEMFHN